MKKNNAKRDRSNVSRHDRRIENIATKAAPFVEAAGKPKPKPARP
jgi:hypothetical protein